MKKIITAGLLAGPAVAMAEGTTPTLDTTAAAGAVTTIQNGITTFLSTNIGPMYTAIILGVFALLLIGIAARFGKKAISGR